MSLELSNGIFTYNKLVKISGFTYLNNLNVILFVIASVGSNQQLLDGIISAIRNVTIRHPLNGETWPGQGMGVHSVVEEGGVFLPDLVFLHDLLLLDFVACFDYIQKCLSMSFIIQHF